MMERVNELDGSREVNDLDNSDARAQLAARTAAFALGLAGTAIVPLAPLAGEDLDLPLPLLAVVLAAAIGVGALAGRTLVAGRNANVALMVLTAWAVAAAAALTWPHEFLLTLGASGVLTGLLLAPRTAVHSSDGGLMPAMSIRAAVIGAAAAFGIMPALFTGMIELGMGTVGAWRIPIFAAGALLTLAAGLYYGLTRPARAAATRGSEAEDEATLPLGGAIAQAA